MKHVLTVLMLATVLSACAAEVKPQAGIQWDNLRYAQNAQVDPNALLRMGK